MFPDICVIYSSRANWLANQLLQNMQQLPQTARLTRLSILTLRLTDNALVAITLTIAESRPEDKDIMTKMIVNLINQHTLEE